MDPVIQPGSNKSEPIKKLCDNLARSMGWSGLEGRCRTCDAPIIGEFRDKLSEEEYLISGMCQDCQDEIFGA